jgi:hypothetical protein
MNLRLRLTNCLIVCFSLFQIALNAQSVSTVGKGTASTEKFPFNGYYDFSWSSSIYEAKDINNTGRLTEISFFVNNSPSNFTMNNQKIYARTTSNSTYSDAIYPSIAGFTLIYEGSITYNGYGKVTIPLTNAFNYNGSSNLEFLFENHDGSYGYDFPYFSYTTTTDGRVASKRDYKDGNFPASCFDCRTVTGFADIEMKFEACDFAAGNIVTANNNIQPGASTQINLVGHLSSATIQWEFSKDNINFTKINGATAPKYVTTALYSNTFYRVKLTSGDCSMYSPTFEVIIDPSSLITKSVGNGTDQFDKYPFYGYYNYSWSSLIVKANEIDASGRMTSISLQVANNPGITMEHQKIYVRHTKDGEYTNDNYPGTTGFRLVFEGTITYTKAGWKEIIFDETFLYNGVDNLEFLFENHDGSYASNYPYFVGTRNVAAYQIKRDYQDPSFPSSCVSCRKYMNSINMQMKFVPCQITAGSISTAQTLVPIGDRYTLNLNNADQGATIAWQRKTELNAFETIEQANQATFAATMLGAPITYRALVTNGCSNTTNEITFTPDACFTDTIIIGDSNINTYKYPFNGYYDYSWSSAIYKASEINHPAGRMASIQFNVTNSPTNFRMDKQKIYVRHSQENTYTDNVYSGTTGFTLIYDGAITYNGSGWMEIPFSEFFEYDGTSNLEFLFESHDGSYGLDYPTFEYTDGKTEIRVKRDYQDYSFPSSCVRCNRYTNLPNVKFKFLPQVGFEGEISAEKTSLCSDESTIITLRNQMQGTSITWESSADNQNFQLIPNETNNTLKIQNVSTSTYFRSVLSKGACTRPSEAILIEAYCPVVAVFDENTETGSITVDISGIPDKVGPYHYLISESSLGEFEDYYHYLRDTIFDGDLDSLKFYQGFYNSETHLFNDLHEGEYFVAAFDSRGVKLLENRVSLEIPLTLNSNKSIIKSKNYFETLENQTRVETSAYLTTLSESSLEYNLNNLASVSLVGLLNSAVEYSDVSLVDYGFVFRNGSIYTLEKGIEQEIEIESLSDFRFKLKMLNQRIHYYVNDQLIKQSEEITDFLALRGVSFTDKDSKLTLKPMGLKPKPMFFTHKVDYNDCLGSLASLNVKLFPVSISGGGQVSNFSSTLISNQTNEVILPDNNSNSIVYNYSNIEAGIYTLVVNYMNAFGSPSQLTKVIIVDSKIQWTNLINMEYNDQTTALTGLGNVSNYLSQAKSNNQVESTYSIYYIDFNVADLKTTDSRKYFIWSNSNDAETIFQLSGFQFIQNMYNGSKQVYLNNQFISNYTNSTRFRYTYNRITGETKLFKYNNQNLQQIGSTIVIPNNKRFVKALTNQKYAGFINVTTNLHCQTPNIYAKLERTIKGVNYKAYQNKLFFYYEEEYKSNSLNYTVVDKNQTIVMSPNSLLISKVFGDNRYELDVTSLAPGTYTLQVSNDKNEKFFLRFTKL